MVSMWYCGEWWVLVLTSAAVLTSWTRAMEPPPGAPRCRDPGCRYLRNSQFGPTYFMYYYEVAGNPVRIGFELSTPHYIVVNCENASVLESPAMPRFELVQDVQHVKLVECPLPSTGSLLHTLTIFNVTLCKLEVPNESCELELINPPPAGPPLSGRHFAGFEHVQTIKIDNYEARNTGTRPRTDPGFLKALKYVKKLVISNVELPTDELNAVPLSIDYLALFFTGTERLPEAIHSSVNLNNIIIQENIPLDAVAVPPGVRALELESSATTLRLDTAPKVEVLRLYNWVEPLPPPLTSCAKLTYLYLTRPAMRALPDGWLASCTKLKKLGISEARNLITLPLSMFSVYAPLTELVLIKGALETLPDELLYNMLELRTLELNNNRIKRLPSNLFGRRKFFALKKVDLSSNELDGSVFDVLETLETWEGGPGYIEELDLSHNSRIGNVCDAQGIGNGYSKLRNIISLRKLDLSETGVTRICKDWRENMLELQLLNLTNTNISELSFEDLQYTRNLRANVMLEGAPVTTLRITRENYKKMLHAPASFSTVHISRQFECDCRLYWARRALEPPLHALDSIRDLRCVGGGLLRDLPLDELVCAAQEECAASLPAGCECVTYPDDNLDHDRWQVRARFKNSSLGLAARRIVPFYPFNSMYSQGLYLTQNNVSYK